MKVYTKRGMELYKDTKLTFKLIDDKLKNSRFVTKSKEIKKAIEDIKNAPSNIIKKTRDKFEKLIPDSMKTFRDKYLRLIDGTSGKVICGEEANNPNNQKEPGDKKQNPSNPSISPTPKITSGIENIFSIIANAESEYAQSNSKESKPAKVETCTPPYKVKGRWPINLKFAGMKLCSDNKEGLLSQIQVKILEKYDQCLEWSIQGFPNFTKFVMSIKNNNKMIFDYSKLLVTLKGDEWKGTAEAKSGDFLKACKEIGKLTGPDCELFLSEKNYTWHHIEYSTKLLLIPRDLHDSFRHTGACSTGCYPKYN